MGEQPPAESATPDESEHTTKLRLHLAKVSGPDRVNQIIGLFRAITGKEPTEADIEEVRRLFAEEKTGSEG